MGTRGRPQKLTPEIEQKILDALLKDYSVEDAALLTGVHRSTIYGWMKKGRVQKRGKFRDLLDTIEDGLQQSEIQFMARFKEYAGIGCEPGKSRPTKIITRLTKVGNMPPTMVIEYTHDEAKYYEMVAKARWPAKYATNKIRKNTENEEGTDEETDGVLPSPGKVDYRLLPPSKVNIYINVQQPLTDEEKAIKDEASPRIIEGEVIESENESTDQNQVP